MKKSLSVNSALFLFLLALVLLLTGCPEAGAGGDDSEEDDSSSTVFDGLYGGNILLTENDTTFNKAIMVFSVSGSEVDGVLLWSESSEAVAEFTGTLDSSSGEMTFLKSFTNPVVYTLSGSLVLTEAGKVSGTVQSDHYSDGTYETTLTVDGLKNDSDKEIVYGQLQFHTDTFAWETKPYWAAIDDDHDGGNGQVAVGGGYASGSSNMCFMIPNVPAGTYHLYGAVNLSGSFTEPQVDDYSASYNSETPSVVVDDAAEPLGNRYDMTLHPDYQTLWSELEGTWSWEDDYGSMSATYSAAEVGTAYVVKIFNDRDGEDSDGIMDIVYVHPADRVMIMDATEMNGYPDFIKAAWTEPSGITAGSTTTITAYTHTDNLQEAITNTTIDSDAGYDPAGIVATKQ